MEAQLLSAVQIAQDPYADQALKGQAVEYLSYARTRAVETWPAALALFVATDASGAKAYDPQIRYFGLEIIGVMLDVDGPDFLDVSVFNPLKQTFLAYIESEYINGTAEAGQPYLRNKFTHTLALLFTRSYPDLWPTIITDLIGAMRTSPALSSSQDSSLNVNLCILLLRLLFEVSGEIADQFVRGARDWSGGRQGRETRLKHCIRERDAPAAINAMAVIMSEGLDRLALIGDRPDPARESLQEMVTIAIQTVCSFVHWIDINLTVTPVTIDLLYRLINYPFLPFRLGASNTLYKLVIKGLQDPADKVQLARVLRLGDVLGTLEQQTRRPPGTDVEDIEIEYRESLGKVLGALGSELTRLCEEKNIREDIKAAAEELMEPLLPITLQFLADEYDDVSQSVFPFLSALLTHYKHKKKNPELLFTDARKAFLTSLMNVVVSKMQWDPSTDWGPGIDDPEPDEEDATAFADLRRGLKSFMDGLAALDPDSFTTVCIRVIQSTLQEFVNGQPLSWQQVELCLQLLYLYGELNKSDKGLGKGRSGFCIMPSPRPGPTEKKTFDYSVLPVNALGRMMVMLFESQIFSYSHPAVTLQWAEIVVRYSDFFKLKKEYTHTALANFVGPLGIHNPKNNVRNRVFYLLHRFVQESSSEIPPEDIEPLLENVGPVMRIQPDLPDDLDEPVEELLAKATGNGGAFDAQLYLFEAVGTLISLSKAPPEGQVALLQAFTTPLLTSMQQSLQKPRNGPQDILPILEVHHIIMGLGNIAKGFPAAPDTPAPDAAQPVWYSVFGEVAQQILVALDSLKAYRVIRDATKFAYSRLFASAGSTILPYVQLLLQCLLPEVQVPELPDFLAFLGLIMHKFKEGVRDRFDELVLPINTIVSQVLRQPEEGTDDAVMHQEVRRAYLSYINSLMGTSLSSVFISPRNGPGLESVLVVILTLAQDASDQAAQRTAFLVLARMVTVWGTDPSVPRSAIVPPATNGTNGVNGTVPAATPVQQPVPGFERFIYDQLVPLIFRVPLIPSLRPKDAEGVLVFREIANLLLAIQEARGPEFAKYLKQTILPSIGVKPAKIEPFITKMLGKDVPHFRKFFTDTMKERRHGASVPES